MKNIIDFQQFKNNKNNKQNSKQQEIQDSLQKLQTIYNNIRVESYDLESINEFIEEVLTDEFLDVDIEIQLEKHEYSKMEKLFDYLPAIIDNLVITSQEGNELYNKYQNDNSVKSKIDEISSLVLELEVKAYQFSEFQLAYEKRYKHS